MIESYVYLQPALIQTLSNYEDVSIDFSKAEWELMKKVVRVLKPFQEATVMLSCSDASISQVIPFVTTITESLAEETNAPRCFRRIGKRSLADKKQMTNQQNDLGLNLIQLLQICPSQLTFKISCVHTAFRRIAPRGSYKPQSAHFLDSSCSHGISQNCIPWGLQATSS